MKYIIIFLTLFITACSSSTNKPSLDEANELVKNLSGTDSIWTTFPKRHYTGGDGVFIKKTEKDEKRKQIQEAGEQAGVWNVVREEEGTGEFFFSVEKRNFYDRIEPAAGYEYLFTDNPNNLDEYKLLLSTQEKGLVTDIIVKKDSYSKENPSVPIGFYELKIEKTALYDIFRPANSNTWSPYLIFKKVDGQWKIDGQSSMSEDEKRSLLKK